MVEAILDIKHWGPNLGVRLPVAIAKAAQLHVGQRVRVTVDQGCLIITPLGGTALAERLPHREPEHLPHCELERYGSKAMGPPAVGAERC